MSDVLTPVKHLILNLDNKSDHELIKKISHALSVPERILIMEYLLNSSRSLSDIAAKLNIPISSVSRHIDVLSDAGLVYLTYRPGIKGHTKYCSQAITRCTFSFVPPRKHPSKDKEVSVEMPIGMFSECDIFAPCGMLGSTGSIEIFDDPQVFFSPNRALAECLWFDHGFIAYNFPASILGNLSYKELCISFEVCSETSCYNNDWPSDITVLINDVEVITFTSLGDFGGRRGKYTPEYWPITGTQYGILKKITVTDGGVYEDDNFIHDFVTLRDLKLTETASIRLKIGVKKDAAHRGGINLFGKRFGDYSQSIIMTVK
ncbi:MAG: ArsR family transcriptional regulator [Clostridia bacterium]|nr:ArsR family transcriptional regulator [Clostridia bacterium]